MKKANSPAERAAARMARKQKLEENLRMAAQVYQERMQDKDKNDAASSEAAGQTGKENRSLLD